MFSDLKEMTISEEHARRELYEYQNRRVEIEGVSEDLRLRSQNQEIKIR